MARNRKRAKDRRPRHPEGAAIGRGGLAQPEYAVGELAAEPGVPPVSGAPTPGLGEPSPDLAPPEPLQHASPDAELAEAQLALGRLAPQRGGANGAAAPAEREPEPEPGEASFEQPAEPAEARAPRRDGARGGAGSVLDAATPTRIVPAEPLPLRLIAFLQGSWKELQRVQWPDRRQVMQATGVVIGFVIVAGILLGVSDLLSKRIVDFILYGHFS